MLLEAEREIEGRREADSVGDLREGLAGVGEKLAGLREALGFQVLARRLADLPAKESRES